MLPSWGREFVHRGLLDQKIRQRRDSSGFTFRPKHKRVPKPLRMAFGDAPIAQTDFIFAP